MTNSVENTKLTEGERLQIVAKLSQHFTLTKELTTDGSQAELIRDYLERVGIK